MDKFESEAHEKDFILETIRAKSPLNVIAFEVESPFDFYSLFAHHRAEFELDKLINVVESGGYEPATSYLGVELTSTGLVFLNRGGYTKQEVEISRLIAKEKSETRWKRAEVLISLFALFVAFASFINSCQDSKTVTQQSVRIDSLRTRLSAIEDSITLKKGVFRKSK